MPNKLWQFERPCPSSSRRWRAKNEGLCMKNTENADMPKSAMLYWPFAPRRPSGNVSKHARNDPSKSSSSRMAATNPIRGRQWIPLAQLSQYAAPPQGAAVILRIAALLADFFFSGLYGQRSVERQEFAFDNSRPLLQRGNSLFAYAVLDILARPRVPGPRRKGYKPSIDADDLAWWVKSFFDLKDRKSPARQFQRRLRLKEVPTPTVVRYNSEPPKPVLRTYETHR